MTDYIIVQAGGRGTRLGQLTANRPKALVPVDNLPMIFHLFRGFPDKRFIIIADYKKDVLRKYLAAFAEVRYLVVEADGTGTCSGISKALELIPDKEPFMLMWCDLILHKDFVIPDGSRDCVGISCSFPCRWSWDGNVFSETSSVRQGVAGLFVFTDKGKLTDVPASGEFVRWLSGRDISFDELRLEGTREFGTIEEYEKLEVLKCRPFNKMTFADGRVIKEAADGQGRGLAALERKWYEKVSGYSFDNVPEIYNSEPLEMEFVKGKNIYDTELTFEGRKKILSDIVSALEKLHGADRIPPCRFSMKEAYFTKTADRLNKVRGLIPFADEKYITVNGKKCRNVYYCADELEKRLELIRCDGFTPIHGDCTFSNIMLRDDGSVVFIDPRGYFGASEFFGDPLYDWAKLYYSIVGNYDMFNLKRFRLSINEDSVGLSIRSGGWEDTEDIFFELTGADKDSIRLIHAVIWLSLTTYAWQDYDSVCGAFYNGIYYLEDLL